MEETTAEKSRRERRKESRLAKNASKHQSWLRHHQMFKAMKRCSNHNLELKSKSKLDQSVSPNFNETQVVKLKSFSGKHETAEVYTLSEETCSSVARKAMRKVSHRSSKKKRVDMVVADVSMAAQTDLEFERKLSKKFKLKEGKFRGVDDGLNLLIEGMSSFTDIMGQREVPGNGELLKKRSKKSLLSKKHKLSKEGMEVELLADGKEKYIAPHLRARAGNEPEEHTQIRRHIRGLLNRIAESNVESITGELSLIFQSVAHSVASQMTIEETLASFAGVPLGNKEYAAVFAAFVAGMTCLVGIDFSAKFMAAFANCFEYEYHKEDNLSLRNLALLLSYLCIFGVCSSDLLLDFLVMLSKRFTEVDVSTMLAVLECCWRKIKAEDPAAMKNFILNVENTANNLKASSREDPGKKINKRMEFMLETICNTRKNMSRKKEDQADHPRIKKWLQKLGVDNISIRGLTWSKLLDWWWSGDVVTDNVEEIANQIDKDVLETQRMLQLAAAQKMNTDGRRAIFCIIMSGEDYLDTFEKLLRLELPGKQQDRDIMRVLVECCLQEKVFNKYYTVLASKLCEHDKNHKFTLQFCLWDHFKELESMPLLRSMHLAKFVAEMVASFTLSLTVLKTVDMSDISQLTSRRIMHFRILFEAIFGYPENLVWIIFTQLAVIPGLEGFRQGIEFFIKEYIVKTNEAVSQKFKLAKRALNNVEGVLM